MAFGLVSFAGPDFHGRRVWKVGRKVGRNSLDRRELQTAFVQFRPALAGQRNRVALSVILAVVATVLQLLRPWPITLVLDRLVLTEGATSLGPVVGLAALAMVIPSVLGVVNEQLQLQVAKVSRAATVRIRSNVFDHLQRLELVEHQRHYRGDLLMRLMGDVNMVRDLLFPSWLNVLSRVLVVIGAAAVFSTVDWRLFLISLIPMPLLWVTIQRGSSKVKQAARKQRRKEGAIASDASESLRQVGLIKAFAAEKRTSESFRQSAKKAERATMASARQAARMTRLTEVITGIGIGFVLVTGAARVRAGLLTPGELVLVVSYTRMMYKPIRKLTAEGARVGKATACALRVLELMERPVEDHSRGLPVTSLRGDVEFIGVTHRYGDGRNSLVGLSARIPDGALVAVTGENGVGKSTMLSLLLRLHRPSAGTIRIGNVPIDTLQLSSYRDQIAYVPQELALFGGTIRENIAFGRPEASENELLAAADLALFSSVLDQLPDGLETVLEEDGSSLSGGQARRLMLARAALRDASILLLDEPLAGLDPDARRLVSSAIRNLAADRTTLIVHHGDLSELQPDINLRLARPQPSAAESNRHRRCPYQPAGSRV